MYEHDGNCSVKLTSLGDLLKGNGNNHQSTNNSSCLLGIPYILVTVEYLQNYGTMAPYIFPEETISEKTFANEPP